MWTDGCNPAQVSLAGAQKLRMWCCPDVTQPCNEPGSAGPASYGNRAALNPHDGLARQLSDPIAKSAALGKPKSEEVEAVARVLPKSETRRVYNAVLKRYWYHAWWLYAHSIVRGGIDKVHIGLEIKPAA
jgi:hypothetical protein